MKRLKPAFDLDGTCVDLQSVLNPIIFEKTGIDTSNPPEFSFRKSFGIPDDIIRSCLSEAYRRWEIMEIYPGAEELMRKLYEATLEPVYFVTARPFSAATETYKLIERFCKKVPFIAAIIEHDPKWWYLGDYSIYVDDRWKNAQDLAEKGIKVFVPARSYNAGRYGIQNVERLENGLLDLLDKIDILVKH